MRSVLLLVACCLSLSGVAAAAQPENVLMVFSGNRHLPVVVEVDQALTESLANRANLADRDVDLFAELVDPVEFSGAAFEQTFADYLRRKYQDRAPKVIVAAGLVALEFLLRERAELFPGVPVVVLGIDSASVASIGPLPEDMVGIPTEFDFIGTIELALHAHANARRLVVVTGSSALDRAWESEIRAGLASRDTGVVVEYVSGLTTAVVLEHLRNLGPGDVVFSPGYLRDGTGREFLPRETAELMAAASSAPVYGPFTSFIGTGIVGGRMPSYAAMGREAAELVWGILDGAEPRTLRAPARDPAQVHVDWEQAVKWGLSAADFPEDAVLHFKPPPFWPTYRNITLVVLFVVVLQTLLVVALLIERRRRRRTAQKLAESENHMDLAARAARLSTWVWDVGGDRLGATSPLLGESLGRQTVLAARILDTVHPADRERFNRAVGRAIERDEEFDIEYRMLRRDGTVRWIAGRGRKAPGSRGRLAGVALDVTQRKVAELQAEQDRTALTHMARVSMLGQLSASIAHQVNQPLAAILGNAEAALKILERSPVDVEQLKEICAEIVSEDTRAAEVIRRLGALYKRGEMELHPLDLNELVKETLALLRTELMSRQVLSAAELAPGLPMIEGGRVQLQQVLLNLLLNAADAMADVEPSQRRLVVRTELEGARVRLCVADQGPGIGAEDLDKVFEAFWSTKVDGIGVGLAICKSIVAAHQGTLTVTNNADHGVTFCVTLPVHAAQSDPG